MAEIFELARSEVEAGGQVLGFPESIAKEFEKVPQQNVFAEERGEAKLEIVKFVEGFFLEQGPVGAFKRIGNKLDETGGLGFVVDKDRGEVGFVAED